MAPYHRNHGERALSPTAELKQAVNNRFASNEKGFLP